MEELNEEVVEPKKGLTGRSEGKPTILIPGEIESVSKRGVTVAAGTVYDYKQKKFQQDINEGLQQLTDDINQNVKYTLSEHSSEIKNINEALEENIPYVIVYDSQTINIPCDPYGNYTGNEDEIGTLVRLYRGNIVQEIAVDGINIIEPSNPILNTYVNDEDEDKSAFIFVSNSNVSNISDNVEVNFSITDTNNNIYYGKVIFNKVKQGKSAFEEWKDQNPTERANATPAMFISDLKNVDGVYGPKYAYDETAAIADADGATVIYFIPNSEDTTKYDIILVEDGEAKPLAQEVSGDITNYAGIYDVSADHSNTSYATLDLAIAAIANTAKKGGMTIKYKDSDGKYHQYRYKLADTTDNNKFTDEDNWEADNSIDIVDVDNESDFEVGDKRGNVIVRCANGDIETKNFNSAKERQNTGTSNFEPFDETEDYKTGDIVKYGGLLYKFITDHDAGEWDEDDVEQTSLLALTPDIKVVDTVSSDLEFSDNNENVVLRVKNGDIETKNFNSRILYFTKSWKGKIFSILGDSISTFGTPNQNNAEGLWTYPNNRCRYPQSDLFTDVSCQYWYLLKEKLGMKLGVNESWAGSLVSNTQETDSGDKGPNRCMASLARIGHLGENGSPDLIIIFGGTNDAHTTNAVTIGTFERSDPSQYSEAEIANLPVDTFAAAYRTMLIRIQYYYPNARILCLFPAYTRTLYTSTRLDDFEEVIREACDFFGVEYLDLRTVGINIFNKDTYLPDGVHPNALGMQLICNKIIKCLINKF